MPTSPTPDFVELVVTLHDRDDTVVDTTTHDVTDSLENFDTDDLDSFAAAGWHGLFVDELLDAAIDSDPDIQRLVDRADADTDLRIRSHIAADTADLWWSHRRTGLVRAEAFDMAAQAAHDHRDPTHPAYVAAKAALEQVESAPAPQAPTGWDATAGGPVGAFIEWQDDPHSLETTRETQIDDARPWLATLTAAQVAELAGQGRTDVIAPADFATAADRAVLLTGSLDDADPAVHGEVTLVEHEVAAWVAAQPGRPTPAVGDQPQRAAITIPAAWVGLLVHGRPCPGERDVDSLGRPWTLDTDRRADDPHGGPHDRRTVTADAGDGHLVQACLDNTDLLALGYGIVVTVAPGPAPLPTGGPGVCARRIGIPDLLDGNPVIRERSLAMTVEQVADPSGRRRYLLHGVGDRPATTVTVTLDWPTANARATAIDALKALGVTKRAAGVAVDAFAPPAGVSADTFVDVVASCALGVPTAEAVAPILGRLLPDAAVRAFGDARMPRSVVVGGTDGMWEIGQRDWSFMADPLGGPFVPTGLPAGGYPDPRRVAKALRRLFNDDGTPVT